LNLDVNKKEIFSHTSAESLSRASRVTPVATLPVHHSSFPRSAALFPQFTHSFPTTFAVILSSHVRQMRPFITNGPCQPVMGFFYPMSPPWSGSLGVVCAGCITRVVSSEISRGKFPEIYSNLYGNFLNNFSRYNLNYNHIKKN